MAGTSKLVVTTRGRRRWIPLLFWLALIVLTLAVMEVVCWTGFKYRMRPSLAKRFIEIAAYGKSNIPQSIASHPYLLYVNKPGWKGEINQSGLRGPEIPADKPPGVTRILFLGGSTTFSTGVPHYTNAWPWQLGRMLRERTGREVEVLNAGLPYATTAENLSAYIFRYRYLHPDIVVIEAGLNDQVPVWYANYDPEYTHFRGHGVWWEPSRTERLLLKSNIVKLSYGFWLNRVMEVYSMHPYGFDKLNRTETLERVRTNKLEGFRRNLELLTKLPHADGAKVLLVCPLQARREVLTRGSPELQGMEQILTEGFDRHKEALKRVAVETATPFAEPELSHFADNLFLDNVHLTAEGERIKAEEVAGALVKLLP